jgi:hypothetical protein
MVDGAGVGLEFGGRRGEWAMMEFQEFREIG